MNTLAFVFMCVLGVTLQITSIATALIAYWYTGDIYQSNKRSSVWLTVGILLYVSGLIVIFAAPFVP